MRKTSISGISTFFKMWGEGSHNGVHKGKMWIFVTPNGIFSIMEKKRRKKSFSKFCQKTFLKQVLQAWYSDISSYLGQIWVNFDQKWPFLKCPQKSENVIFFHSRKYASSKKLGNSDARFSKNAKNPICVRFGQL